MRGLGIGRAPVTQPPHHTQRGRKGKRDEREGIDDYSPFALHEVFVVVRRMLCIRFLTILHLGGNMHFRKFCRPFVAVILGAIIGLGVFASAYGQYQHSENVEPILRIGEPIVQTPYRVKIAGDYAYIADYGIPGLVILDVHNPAYPGYKSCIETPSAAWDVDVVDTLAYVAATDEGLIIFNVSDPVHPEEVGQCVVADGSLYGGRNSESVGVKVQGDYAYVSDGAGGLTIINVSEPTSPYKVSNIGGEHVIGYRLDVSGNYCYFAATESLWVVNVVHPESPSVIGRMGWEIISGWLRGRAVRVLGDYAYLSQTVRIVSISNPANPIVVGTYFGPEGYKNGWDNKPVAAGDSLYCFYAVEHGMIVLDVHNPASPSPVGYCLDITSGRDSIPLSRGIDVISKPDCYYVYLVGESPGALCIFRVTGIAPGIEETIETPGVLELLQNRPNPCFDRTEISYYLPDRCRVKLTVYDLAGRIVRELVDGVEAPGYSSVVWDGTDATGKQVTSGVYFYRLQAGKYTAHKKLIILK